MTQANSDHLRMTERPMMMKICMGLGDSGLDDLDVKLASAENRFYMILNVKT